MTSLLPSTSPVSASRVLRVVPPEGESVPVVFDSPHSGKEWPADFRPAVPPVAIHSTWDAFVDELCQPVTRYGATLLAAEFPRSYIDTNRALDDIDTALLAEPWPVPVTATDYTQRGMGLIRRDALPGVAMYDRRLSTAEVKARIANYYSPYRTTLRELLDTLCRQHGFVWHVNCHSMKSRGNGMNTDNGALRPNFVVSDRMGQTASQEFTQWAAKWFTGRGFTVKVNDPYRGGDLIRTHGEPVRGRHSIQLEINRALYMDEATFTPGPHFADIQRELARFGQALCERARRKMPWDGRV